MATRETVDRLVAYAEAIGYSNPFPFVVGYLGSMVDEETLLHHVERLELDNASA